MATTKVHAPNETFTGEVAGVLFKDGVGTLDEKENPGARRYFERQGYGLSDKKPRQLETPKPPDPRDIERTGPHRVGTPLRDAAVDPRPEDFLPPTNAGKANPHGTSVVAPEIHASGPKGIKPGDVHVGDLAAQQADETALATSVLIEGNEHPSSDERPGGPIGMSDPGSIDQGIAGAKENATPVKSASQKAWAEFAVSQGMSSEEAAAATRADLITRFGG